MKHSRRPMRSGEWPKAGAAWTDRTADFDSQCDEVELQSIRQEIGVPVFFSYDSAS